jgi:phage gp36-like protein
MTPLVSVSQFLTRDSRAPYIPLDENGDPDAARVNLALAGATGVIVAHLPWLLDKESGEISRPINPQFADALEAVCVDLAVDRLSDVVTGSENTRNRYKESVALLEKINREYQGGLEGPGLMESCIVEPNEAEGIADGRFVKKGGLF